MLLVPEILEERPFILDLYYFNPLHVARFRRHTHIVGFLLRYPKIIEQTGTYMNNDRITPLLASFEKWNFLNENDIPFSSTKDTQIEIIKLLMTV